MVVDIKNKVVCGIYKITSPSNKVYVGQGVNIELRFKRYKRLACKNQRRLYNSFLKYGYTNHKFEIIELCEEKDLNLIERKWQDFYNVLSEKGLNCKLTKIKDHSGKMSEESKLRMRNAKLGKTISKEHKLKMKLNSGKSKKVICTKTGNSWISATECALANNINQYTLRVKLSGNYKNNTTFIYEK